MIESVVAVAVAAMAPYLKALGAKAAETAGDALGARIVPLIAAIRERFRRAGDEGAEAALDDLAAAPDDDAARAAATTALAERAATDPELAALIERVARAAGDTTMTVNVSEGGRVGKVVQARDVQGDINL
jgi:thioredoxin-like negative regulator of GroEL